MREFEQIYCRLFLRRVRPRVGTAHTTMVGGQLIADLCPDGCDRLWSGTVILMPETKLVMSLPVGADGSSVGLTSDQVLTSPTFSDPRTPPWERE